MDYIGIAERIEFQKDKLLRNYMRLLIVSLFALLFVGCADNNLTMKGVQAFDAEDYSLAHEELAPLAARGNPEAQFYIGKMNDFGFGVPKDLDIAFIRYTDSAEQGYMKAQHNLGLMYANGFSVDANPELGYEWISKAAAQGLANSQHMMGVGLSMAGSPLQRDIPRGLDYYKAAAAQNYPPALTQIGAYYADVEAEYGKAGEYFKKASDLGDAEAMWRLSYGYKNGYGGRPDLVKAFELLKGSAEKGFSPAFHDLAVAYMQSSGVNQDYNEAILWLKKSVKEANDPRAMESLAQMQLEQRSVFATRVQNLDSIESGLELRQKAAELGDSEAQWNLFIQYYNGAHVPANKKISLKWLKASAKGGNLDAQFALGKQYLNGWDVPKDEKKAIALYESAANGGHSKATIALGSAYASGVGVKSNSTMALEWLNKANEKDAGLMIGLVYMMGGNGVPQDRELAEESFRKSEDAEAKVMLTYLYLLEDYGTVDINRGLSLVQEVQADLEGQNLGTVQVVMALAYIKAENWSQATPWLTKASQNGSSDAQRLLGQSLLYGENVVRDVQKGRYWLAQSAENGDFDAGYALGMSYYKDDEQGLADPVTARKWFRESARDGNGASAMMLGLTYMGELSGEKLRGYTTDLVTARHWLEIASKAGNEIAANGLVRIDQYEKSKVRKLKNAERQLVLKKAREKRDQLAQVEAQEVKKRKSTQTKNSSLGANLVDGFFKALGEGIGYAVSAKIDKELGVNRYDSRNLSAAEISAATRKGTRAGMRSALREQEMLNRPPPSIGYTTNGKSCNPYTVC